MAITVERGAKRLDITMNVDDAEEFGRRVDASLDGLARVAGDTGLARVGGGPLGQRRLADRDTGELIDEDGDDEGAGPPTPEELYAAYWARMAAEVAMKNFQAQAKMAKTELEIASGTLFKLLHRLRGARQ